MTGYGWPEVEEFCDTGDERKHCASCHMPSGGGIPGTFPPLKESSAATGDKGTLIRTVLTGNVISAGDDDREYAESMPAFDFLSDAERYISRTSLMVT